MKGYTAQQLLWLKENCENFSTYKKMGDKFNEIFAEEKSWKNLHATCKRHGYIQTNHLNCSFTSEQRAFLESNLPFHSYREITKLFNEEFSLLKTVKQIQSFCIDNGIKRGLEIPIGSEHRSGKYIMVKVRENEKGVPNHKIWRMKQQVVWEQNYGKIPRGKIIIFLDNNSLNCDISNLYLADRKILNLLTVNKWHFSNREQKLAALKWCELYFSMGKDIKPQNPNKQVHIPMTEEERWKICLVCGKKFEVFQRRKAITCSIKCASTLNHGESLRKYMVNNPKEKHFCKVEGCNNPVHGLGYCDLHYHRFKKTGSPYGVKRITYNSRNDVKTILFKESEEN